MAGWIGHGSFPTLIRKRSTFMPGLWARNQNSAKAAAVKQILDFFTP
jgi:hypothetical protein